MEDVKKVEVKKRRCKMSKKSKRKNKNNKGGTKMEDVKKVEVKNVPKPPTAPEKPKEEVIEESKTKEERVQSIIDKKEWEWEDVVGTLTEGVDVKIAERITETVRKIYRGSWKELKSDGAGMVKVIKLIEFLATIY